MTTSKKFKTVLMTGVALAGVFSVAPAFAQQAAQPVADERRDVVIVTATRREEDVRDVAASVSAVTGDRLEETGAQSFSDYVETVPGAAFNSYTPGWSHVVLRGIATSSGNEQGQGTVGYYINDVPLTEPGWTMVVPDIDTFDVNRVEVLRGPQGARFGSASLGGVVNYIANTADASAFDAAVEATGSSTENADDLGYGFKGMVNIPIAQDTFAVRGVYNYRQDAGYLDNIGTGEDGSNEAKVQGGRLSAVWTPDDLTEIAYLGLTQKTEVSDAFARLKSLGEFERSTAIPEPMDTEVTVHSLRFNRDLGFADLTAVGAITERSQDWRFDFTPILVFYNADLQTNMPGPLYINSGGDSDGASFEVRLASKGDGPLQWQAGAMWFKTDKFLYEQIGSPGAAAAFNASPLFGAGSGAVISPDGEIFNAFYSDVEGEEIAAFGELSWQFSPEWEVSAGGRLFRTEVSTESTQVGFSTYPGNPIVNSQTTEDDGFSPIITVEWRPSADLMLYALRSEGFRFGQPNNIPPLAGFDTPDGSNSDSLTNYEIGVRASPLADLTLDATAFYVDWSDIQIRLTRPDFFNYAGNGGGAESKGVEVALGWTPTDQLSLRSALTWLDAELTEPLVIPFAGTVPAGTQLPGSAEWTLASTLTYVFTPEIVGVLSHRYIGEGLSDLNGVAVGAPNEQGDYNVVDARLRFALGQTGVTVFASNLTDERGITRSVVEVAGPSEGYVRPRTIGVTLDWNY